MKTIEEKAREYAGIPQDVENPVFLKFNSDIYGHYARIKHEAYLSGANEAMRWRDPKVELPVYYKKVQLKIKNGDIIDYVCASLLGDDDGSLLFGDYNHHVFVRVEDVIGWRPIE